MPIFEYNCNNCGHRFEFLQLNKNEKVNCPECNSKNLARLFSVFGYLSGHVPEKTSESNESSKCSGCSSRSCATCK